MENKKFCYTYQGTGTKVRPKTGPLCDFAKVLRTRICKLAKEKRL
jgi:hypothetical protein